MAVISLKDVCSILVRLADFFFWVMLLVSCLFFWKVICDKIYKWLRRWLINSVCLVFLSPLSIVLISIVYVCSGENWRASSKRRHIIFWQAVQWRADSWQYQQVHLSLTNLVFSNLFFCLYMKSISSVKDGYVHLVILTEFFFKNAMSHKRIWSRG